MKNMFHQRFYRLLLLPICIFLMGLANPHVLGADARTHFDEIIRSVNEGHVLGDGITIMGVDIAKTQVVVHLQRGTDYSADITLVESTADDTKLKGQYFGIAKTPESTNPDPLEARLLDLVDHSFSDNPFRDPNAPVPESKPPRIDMHAPQASNDTIYGLPRTVFMIGLAVVAGLFVARRLLLQRASRKSK